MYVRDLKNGILIRPKGRWQWSIHKLHHEAGTGSVELEQQGVYYHSSVRYTSSFKQIRHQDTAVYLGKQVLKKHYYGLKTHHLILVNGMIAAMDGYSFKDLEKI
jgi:hypothetical protein